MKYVAYIAYRSYAALKLLKQPISFDDIFFHIGLFILYTWQKNIWLF